MAVVGFAKEIPGFRQATESQGGQVTYRRRFLVQTDSAQDGPATVLNAPLLPQVGEFYLTGTEYDQSARVVSRTPSQADKSRTVWYVDVDYDSETELDPAVAHPLAEPPSISLDFEQYSEVITGERDDTVSQGESDIIAFKSGILNSAGEPYIPFPEREAARPVVVFSRNEANVSVAVAAQFINSVNRTYWSGLLPRQALLRGIRAQSRLWTVNNTDVRYYEVEYVFVLKRETWDLQLLDCGSYYKAYSTTNPSSFTRIPFPAGQNGVRKGLLDHSNPLQPGKRLAPGAAAQFNRYRLYKEEDFGYLNINLNLALDLQRRPRRR